MSLARRPLVAGIAVLGAAALIAGCGGGSSDSSSPAITGTATSATATADATGTATAPTAPADTTGTAGLSGQNAAYVQDAKAAATKLQEFGAILQSTTSLADLKTKVPEAEAKLDEFDAAIAKLDTYTLDNPTLEKQRAGLAATGPKVSEVLNKFIQAASTGDTEAVQAVVPELSAAIQEFQNAATP